MNISRQIRYWASLVNEELFGLFNAQLTRESSGDYDSRYMQAIKDEDEQKLKQLVLDACKKAMPNTKLLDKNGNPLIVFHGTTATQKFNVFDIKKTGDGMDVGKGFYFTADNEEAKGYLDLTSNELLSHKDKQEHKDEYQGKRIIAAFLDITNPWKISTDDLSDSDAEKVLKLVYDFCPGIDKYIKHIDSTSDLHTQFKQSRFVKDETGKSVKKGITMLAGNKSYREFYEKFLPSKGYDGIIDMTVDDKLDRPGNSESTEDDFHVIVWDNRKIKLADPITYDDDGNVIPLSKRFNMESQDIRENEMVNESKDSESSYIRYWAALVSESCDESSDSVLEGKKRNQQTLSNEQISLNIKRSMTNLMKTTRVDHFLFVFSDGNEKSVDVRRKGHQYKLKFNKGNRDFGAQKIARLHLIDGGCAYSGCFSLAELNRDLKQILTSGNLNFKGTTMELSWTNSYGLEWWIIAFKKGNEWIVNSIHTTRNQSTTRKIQNQALSQSQKK